MIYNPYQYQQPVQLVRVNGIEGARAYAMPPNSTAALFDASDDLLYIKVTDGAGFGTIRTFEFHEKIMAPIDSKFITKDETDGLKAEISQLRKQMDEIKEAFNNGKQALRKRQSDAAE